MNNRIIAATAIALGLITSPVLAQKEGPSRISLTRAVAIAERNSGGHVLDAELEESKGRLFYEVEVARENRLQELLIDAETGKVVKKSAPFAKGYYARWFESDRLGKVGSARPLSEILTRIEQQTGGQVIEASFDIEGGRPRYEVELATRAGVADVALDPRTGDRLRMALDD